MIIDTIEYSVCIECMTLIEHGVNDNTSEERDAIVEKRMQDELAGRKGHWVAGIAAGADSAYNEFSSVDCPLCRSGLAGERHGVTMILEGEPAPTVTRRVVWEIDVIVSADESDRDVAQNVADLYFQDRIHNGEPDTACVFKVMREWSSAVTDEEVESVGHTHNLEEIGGTSWLTSDVDLSAEDK